MRCSARLAPALVPDSPLTAPTRAAEVSFVALCLLFLAGCSSVAFFYNRLDSLASYYLGAYVSLTPEQSTRLGSELVALRQWHCGTQLPIYADLLHSVGAEIQTGGIEPARLEAYFERLQAAWHELVAEASPRLAALMLTVTPAQVAQMFGKLEKDNAAFKAKYVERPRAEIQADQAQQMERALRQWLGRLTPAQRELVAAWSRELVLTGGDRLAARLAWQAELRRLLAARTDEAAFRREVHRLLVRPEQFWPEGYRERRAHNRARTLALLASLTETLTAEQRQHFVARARAWARDFDRLSCPLQVAGSSGSDAMVKSP